MGIDCFHRCRTRRSVTAAAPTARPVIAAAARRLAEAGMSPEQVGRRGARRCQAEFRMS